MKLKTTYALVLMCISGCASHQKLIFSPWNADKSSWKQYELNGIQFSIPGELPQVQLNPELIAFCLSGYKAEAYLPGPYTPADAIYVFCRAEKNIESDDMYKNIANIQIKRGIFEKVSQPVAGYLYWLPMAYSNKDNSRGINDSSIILDLSWGYLFYSKDGKICKVYLEKWCNKTYRSINVNQIISPAEQTLISNVVGTVNSIR